MHWWCCHSTHLTHDNINKILPHLILSSPKQTSPPLLVLAILHLRPPQLQPYILSYTSLSIAHKRQTTIRIQPAQLHNSTNEALHPSTRPPKIRFPDPQLDWPWDRPGKPLYGREPICLVRRQATLTVPSPTGRTFLPGRLPLP